MWLTYLIYSKWLAQTVNPLWVSLLKFYPTAVWNKFADTIFISIYQNLYYLGWKSSVQRQGLISIRLLSVHPSLFNSESGQSHQDEH